VRAACSRYTAARAFRLDESLSIFGITQPAKAPLPFSKAVETVKIRTSTNG
jgi:hypothetical protein